MTHEEQRLADDKMRAEIAKLFAETAKITTDRLWQPIAVIAGILVAVSTVTGTLLGVLL